VACMVFSFRLENPILFRPHQCHENSMIVYLGLFGCTKRYTTALSTKNAMFLVAQSGAHGVCCSGFQTTNGDAGSHSGGFLAFPYPWVIRAFLAEFVQRAGCAARTGNFQRAPHVRQMRHR
jgi:hypothetical protein